MGRRLHSLHGLTLLVLKITFMLSERTHLHDVFLNPGNTVFSCTDLLSNLMAIADVLSHNATLPTTKFTDAYIGIDVAWIE